MPPLHAAQQQIVDSPARFKVVVAGRRWGKALALDTPLPTPTGWTTMGDVKVGDTLFDENGQPCTVTFISDIHDDRPCFEVVFDDKTTVIADAEHEWLTWDAILKRESVVTTRRIGETLRYDGGYTHRVTARIPVSHRRGDVGWILASITAVAPRPSVPVRCIQVDSPSSLFLCSHSFIPTHNTKLATALIFYHAARGGTTFWVVPVYKTAKPSWRDLKAMARMIPNTNIRDGDMTIEFGFSAGTISVRSAEHEDNLRGESLDYVVLDEAGYLSPSVWHDALRPALMDRKGGALLIGSPAGMNWFKEIYDYACQKEHYPEYQGWQFTSQENPFLPPEEIEQARKSMTERSFKQEILGIFMDDSSQVFRNITRCATASYQEGPQPGHEYVVGVDWGRSEDFTVITVIDATAKAMCAWERFNNLDYLVQASRLEHICRLFSPTIAVVEANTTESLISILRERDLPVRPFTTNIMNKASIIDKLVLALEQETIRILPERVLINELQAFGVTRTPTGRLQYAAPGGMHDDTILSLALALSAVDLSGTTWESIYVPKAPDPFPPAPELAVGRKTGEEDWLPPPPPHIALQQIAEMGRKMRPGQPVIQTSRGRPW